LVHFHQYSYGIKQARQERNGKVEARGVAASGSVVARSAANAGEDKCATRSGSSESETYYKVISWCAIGMRER
jgi:hypothetical protein